MKRIVLAVIVLAALAIPAGGKGQAQEGLSYKTYLPVIEGPRCQPAQLLIDPSFDEGASAWQFSGTAVPISGTVRLQAGADSVSQTVLLPPLTTTVTIAMGFRNFDPAPSVAPYYLMFGILNSDAQPLFMGDFGSFPLQVDGAWVSSFPLALHTSDDLVTVWVGFLPGTEVPPRAYWDIDRVSLAIFCGD